MNKYNGEQTISTNGNSYKLIEQLGQQQDGIIFKALNLENNKFVLLIISKIMIQNKLKLLKAFEYQKNDNLVNILDYYQKDGELIIIMEWINGTLTQIYQNIKNNYQIQIKFNYLMQILQGLKILHQYHLIYYDLNPNNIVFIQQNDDYQIKLFIPGLPRLKYNQIGLQYKAPEQLQNCNQKVDIWAYGIIFYEIISGKYMYQGINNGQIQQNIAELVCQNEIKVLLTKMLLITETVSAENLLVLLEQIRLQYQAQPQKNPIIQQYNQNNKIFSSFNILKQSTTHLTIASKQYLFKEKIYDCPKAQVYKAVDTQTQQIVVIKKQQKAQEKELAILQLIKQQQLKQFIKIIDFCNQGNHLYIVMELADGSLSDLIKKDIGSEVQRLEWFKQITIGVFELHKLGMIHRDLKPDNILFKRVQNTYQFMLSDADLTTFSDSAIKTQNVGTQQYMAPEIFLQEYDEKADIWSLGLILYDLLINENDLEKDHKLKRLNRKHFYPQFEQVLQILPIKNIPKVLLKGMLQLDQKKRFSAQQVLSLINQSINVQVLYHKQNPIITQNDQFLLKMQQDENKKLQEDKYKQLEQVKKEMEIKIRLARNNVEENFQKQITTKEQQITEVINSQEIIMVSQELDSQQKNHIKVKMEINKQNEIAKCHEEQQQLKEQQIKEEIDQIKFQYEQILQQKLQEQEEQWQKKIEVEKRKQQEEHEENIRLLKLQQEEQQKKLLVNEKDALKFQMLFVLTFVNNQIEVMTQNQAQSQLYDSQIQQVETMSVMIDQFLTLLKSEKNLIEQDIQMQENLILEEVQNQQRQYKQKYIQLKEQTEKYCQQIKTDTHLIQIRQRENEGEKQNLENKVRECDKITMNNSLNIRQLENIIQNCFYQSPELLLCLEQIKELHWAIEAQMQVYLNSQQNIDFNQISNRMKEIESVFKNSNQVGQQILMLSDDYTKLKEQIATELLNRKQFLLDQGYSYLEQASTYYELNEKQQSAKLQDIYSQIIQEGDELKYLLSQIEELQFISSLEDDVLQINEILLNNLQIELEKLNRRIEDSKQNFLIVQQNEKEALKVAQLREKVLTNLMQKINFEKILNDLNNDLIVLQNLNQQFSNQELIELINQKMSKIQQEKSQIDSLKSICQENLQNDSVQTMEQLSLIENDLNNQLINIENRLNLEQEALKELEFRVKQTYLQSQTSLGIEISEITHSLVTQLSQQISQNIKNTVYLSKLDFLKTYSCLQNKGLCQQIQELKNKYNQYKRQYAEVLQDIDILKRQQNKEGIIFPNHIKIQKMTVFQNQLLDYQNLLKIQLEQCEEQLQRFHHYQDVDVEKLQVKLAQQITKEEKLLLQNHNMKQIVQEMQNQYNEQKNGREVMQKLRNLEAQFQLIRNRVNYQDLWQDQIDVLNSLKKQFQLCKCYVLLSNLFDFERLCQRWFKSFSKQLSLSTIAQQNQQQRRNQNIQEVQKIIKLINEKNYILNQQVMVLCQDQYPHMDITAEFEEIENFIKINQVKIENEIRQKNLVKLRGVIRNQNLIQQIKTDFFPHLEGNRMKIIELLQQK